MKQNLAKALFFVSSGLLVLGVGCSDDETTGSGGTGGTGTTTTSGMGGDASGGSGGGDEGGGGGAACVTCGTFLSQFGQHETSALCGYQSEDPGTGELTCDPGSSCEIFSAAVACTCSDCVADCGDNVCMGMTITPACAACAEAECKTEQDACFADS